MSKWILGDAEIFILDNPTQGVDIGAKEEIYRLIESLAQEGKSFIVLSSEFQETIRLCNRIVVMYQGEIMDELDSSECNEERLMLLSTGSYKEASHYE